MSTRLFEEAFSPALRAKMNQDTASTPAVKCYGFRYLSDGTIKYLSPNCKELPCYVPKERAGQYSGTREILSLDPGAGVCHCVNDFITLYDTHDYTNACVYLLNNPALLYEMWRQEYTMDEIESAEVEGGKEVLLPDREKFVGLHRVVLGTGVGDILLEYLVLDDSRVIVHARQIFAEDDMPVYERNGFDY